MTAMNGGMDLYAKCETPTAGRDGCVFREDVNIFDSMQRS
jgi:hypothetical protein